jgi:glycosyltransferase involved in cell wall biosynthesis
VIRVLHAFIWFSISKGGGTCDLINKLAIAQQKRKDLVPIIFASKDYFDRKLKKNLDKTSFILSINLLNLFNLNFNSPSFIKIFKNKTDIVHMHLYRSMQNVFLYLYCIATKTPYIMDAHGSVPFWNKGMAKKKLFDLVIGKRIMLNASAWIAESKVGIKEYIDYFPELIDKDIDLISPPFGIEEFVKLPNTSKQEFLKKYNIKSDKKIISFLGRLHQEKGIDFLLRGISKLKKNNIEVECLLVGPDDGFEGHLRNMAKELLIAENIHFLGFKSGNDKNEILMNSDLVVQLSRFEQGAWAPIEGLLCDTPILVTRDTGSGEDVKRLNAGYLVNYNDDEEFVSQVQSIFNNYEAALQKTKKAKEYIIKNLSMEARMDEYLAVYNKCIRDKKI